MSDIWIKKSNTNPKWAKAVAIHIKRYSGATTKWFAAKVIWIKNTSSGWLRVWPTSGVFAITDPYITTTSSGSTPLYGNNTVSANDVIRIGTTYYGRNGTWDPNGFSISSYSYSWPYYSSSDNTISYDEIGTLSSGVYSSPSQALTISSSTNATATDGKYISFRITANASNALYSNTADSRDSYGKIKVIRRTPINLSFAINGSATIGSTLSIGSSWNITEAYKPDAIRTTIKWYRSDSATNIYSGQGRTEITSASGSYQYTLTSPADSGKYIIAEETTFNTGSDYDIGIDQFINGQNQVTAVTGQVGLSLLITNGRVEDYYNNNGLDNRFDFPVGALQAIKATISGVDSSTTYRIRYRVYSWQNGSYYNVETGATGTASAVWTTYTADSTGSGNISSVIISGSTASLIDYIFIDQSLFDGGTYGGGLYKWQIEIELSAIKSGGTRVYWVDPYQSYYLSRSINSTISASPSTISPGSSTTISGSFFGYPAGNAYPRQYKINYGDGTNSGWLPVGEYSYGTSNPSYSLSKTYSSTGTYFPSIETIPYYTTNSTTVTVANVVSQISAPTARATNTFSTSTVKYLDSITWSAGTYSNASSVSSVLLYATNTSGVASPGGNTSTSFRTTNPYTLTTIDPAPPAYIFAVRDTVVGTNGITYYFYSNQITSALADGISFSYGTATSTSGGWTASINSGSQSGATYSYVSATAGSGSVNSSTGFVTASGLSSNQFSTITIQKSVSGYNNITTTASGQSGIVATVPTAPTSVFASNITSSGARINWSAPTSNGGSPITGYEVNRDGFAFFSVGNVFFYDYFISVAGNYTIGVRAINSVGAGPASYISVTIPSPPPPATPAITSGPFISWGSGNDFTLSASASNATNIEFQVQYANTSGGTVQNTVTYFMGASAGSRTTGAQSYPWARTRARANNTTTGLSSAFTPIGYTGWA